MEARIRRLGRTNTIQSKAAPSRTTPPPKKRRKKGIARPGHADKRGYDPADMASGPLARIGN